MLECLRDLIAARDSAREAYQWAQKRHDTADIVHLLRETWIATAELVSSHPVIRAAEEVAFASQADWDDVVALIAAIDAERNSDA